MMTRAHHLRKVLVAILVLQTGACGLKELIAPKPLPPESPGKQFTRAGTLCRGIYQNRPPCAAWSADDKKFFVIGDSGLVVVDLSAFAQGASSYHKNLGKVGVTQALASTPDGSALYLSRPVEGNATGFEIVRLAVASGGVSMVSTAAYGDMSLSPDGTRLAYHAAGSSPNSDTITVRNLTTNTREAVTIGRLSRVGPFSPDGGDLVLSPTSTADTVQVWHIAAAMRENGSASIKGAPIDYAWTANGLVGLLPQADQSVGEVIVATGEVRLYLNLPPVRRKAVAWASGSARVFAAYDDDNCYLSQQCFVRHYDLLSATHEATSTVGSVNAGSFTTPFPVFMVSPSGRWLYHAAADGFPYLLSIPR